MEGVRAFLLDQAEGDILHWRRQAEAADRFGLPFGVIEETALELGLLPARYQRNRKTVSVSGQLTLFRSKVAVIGCGGLGGYVIEELARLGVGRILAIDPDVFVEHNLNRQLLATPSTLGRAKVDAAHARVADINPAVTVTPVMKAFCAANGRELFDGVQVVVDGLDSIPTRLELAETCGSMGIPLVHGTIGGWYGHVATQFPGEDTVQTIYRNWVEGKGIEKLLGNPSFTPAVVAGLEVAEVCKILLGEGELLRRRKLFLNLLDMEIQEIRF